VPAGRVVSKQVVPPLTNSSKMHALSAEEEEDEPTDSTFEENTKQALTPGSDVAIAASIAATSPGKTNASEIHVSSVTAQAMKCHRQQPSDTIVCMWKATTGLRVRDGRISIIRRCYDTQVKEYWRTQLHQPRCHTSCNVHANCNGFICVHHVSICMFVGQHPGRVHIHDSGVVVSGFTGVLFLCVRLPYANVRGISSNGEVKSRPSSPLPAGHRPIGTLSPGTGTGTPQVQVKIESVHHDTSLGSYA
jgi:hypothetical protein